MDFRAIGVDDDETEVVVVDEREATSDSRLARVYSLEARDTRVDYDRRLDQDQRAPTKYIRILGSAYIFENSNKTPTK